jgi:hypothetical protein
MKVRVQLKIDRLENLIEAGLEEGYSLMLKVGWVGSKMKMKYLYKNVKENHTSVKPIEADGVACWGEEFDHVVKLKRIKPEGYKSWFLYLKVQVSLIISITFYFISWIACFLFSDSIFFVILCLIVDNIFSSTN